MVRRLVVVAGDVRVGLVHKLRVDMLVGTVVAAAVAVEVGIAVVEAGNCAVVAAGVWSGIAVVAEVEELGIEAVDTAVVGPVHVVTEEIGWTWQTWQKQRCLVGRVTAQTWQK